MNSSIHDLSFCRGDVFPVFRGRRRLLQDHPSGGRGGIWCPILTVSNIVAYPDASAPHDDVTVLNNEIPYFYADSVIWVCPNANQFYDRGTYAVAVTAGTPTSFVLEVKVSPQTLPIPEPPVRISCDDVPPEEYIWGPQSICVEDGRTKDLFTVRESLQIFEICFLTLLLRMMFTLCTM
jgi:hypothetical protein